jgi:hypothetical protein
MSACSKSSVLSCERAAHQIQGDQPNKRLQLGDVLRSHGIAINGFDFLITDC